MEQVEDLRRQRHLCLSFQEAGEQDNIILRPNIDPNCKLVASSCSSAPIKDSQGLPGSDLRLEPIAISLGGRLMFHVP